MTLLFGGLKSPRNLLEVLAKSSDFEVSDPEDILYAVLGMYNVTAFTRATERQLQYPKDAVLVDYTKSLAEVYRDTSSCILHRQGEPANLANLWNSYKEGSLHAEGLPRWAIDWASHALGEDYQMTGGSHSPSCVLKTPLGGLPSDRVRQSAVTDEATGPTRIWHWLQPIESDPNVLRLNARVLNYVAHLIDYTCEPSVFNTTVTQGQNEVSGRLGLAGRSIHCKRMQRELGANYALVYPVTVWEDFNPRVHLWRLDILGVGNDSQLCLV
jgi:hypothetical protein